MRFRTIEFLISLAAVKPDLSPTGRALRALELLQAQPGITAAHLAAQLGVTERAARRYVAILREADIPVESTRGPYGGYRVGRGIRLPPLVFTAAEALGLVMAVLDGSHAAADADDPVGAALGKIIRALPENVSRPAATMRQHACAAPDRAAVRPGAGTTSALVAAVADQRRVRIGYRSESGRQWQEDVDPWAVVVRHGRWYLLCHSHRARAVRAYRIDRIQSAAANGGQFPPPGDLDYADLLEQHLGAGWEFETKVVFDAPYDEAARYVRPPMGRLDRIGDGKRCVLTGTTSNPAMYAGEWLAAIPIPFHVEGGPELRAAVTAVTQRLMAALGAPPGNEPSPPMNHAPVGLPAGPFTAHDVVDVPGAAREDAFDLRDR
jgi:predicted DNA-binding transcriptional regulator YafY